jgi:SMP-30/gluconolaconase/LRE-like protein
MRRPDIRVARMAQLCAAVVCASVLAASAGACSDDASTSTSNDAGPDARTAPPPPPPPDRDAAGPPDGIDTTGRLGTAVLVADVGAPTDGPSWRSADQALYFTVPSADPPFRRLVADGGVESIAYDGTRPGPYGTANGGGERIFVTERDAIDVVDVAPDGGATYTRRKGSFELLGDVAAGETDASVSAFFVDTAGSRAYRYDPAAGSLSLLVDIPDAGRATAIALGPLVKDTERTVYVAVGSGAGSTIVSFKEGSPAGAERFPLQGTAANGIAIDVQGSVYVAWAGGIDVYFSRSRAHFGNSPGLPLKAAPTSLTFGGADRMTLFVTTAAGKIYAIPTRIPGVLR